MANEFLNKARDAVGSVIYTASTEDTDGKPVTRVQFKDAQPVQLSASNLQEQKTQTNAVSGVLTFAENIKYIEIYNRDETNDGTFNVNGIDILVPKSTPQRISVFENPIGGTPRKTVNVSGSTSYIVSRYS